MWDASRTAMGEGTGSVDCLRGDCLKIDFFCLEVNKDQSKTKTRKILGKISKMTKMRAKKIEGSVQSATHGGPDARTTVAFKPR